MSLLIQSLVLLTAAGSPLGLQLACCSPPLACPEQLRAYLSHWLFIRLAHRPSQILQSHNLHSELKERYAKYDNTCGIVVRPAMERGEASNCSAERTRAANQGHLIRKQTSLRYVKMWEVMPEF